jgi:hypothetical protein
VIRIASWEAQYFRRRRRPLFTRHYQTQRNCRAEPVRVAITLRHHPSLTALCGALAGVAAMSGS